MRIANKGQRLFTFFALVQTLSDFLEENDIPDNIDYKFQVKHHAKELRKLLPNMIDRMIQRTEKESDPESVDQYVRASQIMEHLFGVGLRMECMEPEIKKQTLVTQLNILLNSYGLPQLELVQETGKTVTESDTDVKT